MFLVAALPDGDDVTLDGPEGRHAARVRRISVGELLDVGDGRGIVSRCTVVAVDGDALRLEVVDRRVVAGRRPRLVVVQALAKGERSELAVELLTELGVDVIVPWAAERSIVQWRGERKERALQRWRSTAREATKQSRRAWVPEVTDLHTTDQVAGLDGALLVLHEAAYVPLTGQRLPADGDLVLVVGPEGGLTKGELAAFTAAGAVTVRLGPEVLRTSTAGGAAVAALSGRLDRWA